MIQRRIARVGFAVVAALSLLSIPVAQAGMEDKGTAKVKVVIKDQSGTPIEGIEVQLDAPKRGIQSGIGSAGSGGTIKSASGDQARHPLGVFEDAKKIKTDKDGVALFEGLKAGRYRVTIADSSDYEGLFQQATAEAGKTITKEIKLTVKKK